MVKRYGCLYQPNLSNMAAFITQQQSQTKVLPYNRSPQGRHAFAALWKQKSEDNNQPSSSQSPRIHPQINISPQKKPISGQKNSLIFHYVQIHKEIRSNTAHCFLPSPKLIFDQIIAISSYAIHAKADMKELQGWITIIKLNFSIYNLDDKVLKSQVLVILDSFLSFQDPNLLSITLAGVHFYFFGENFHLSYLVIENLVPIAHFPLFVFGLVGQVNCLDVLVLVFLQLVFLNHLHSLWNFWNIVDLVRVGGLGTLALPAPGPLDLGQEVPDALDGDYLALYEFVLEELHELFTLQVLLEASCGQKFSGLWGLLDPADAAFVGVHEGDHGGEYGAYVPAGAPGFLVVVGEGGAYGFSDLEAAIIGEEAYFRGREGVIFGQFEYSVVETLAVLFFEVIEAKVEIEVGVPDQHHGGDGLFLDRLHLLVDSNVGNLLAHFTYISYSLLNYQYIFINLS